MKYTVKVKEIIDSNGKYESKRYNKVPKRIIKFLVNNKFSFSIGLTPRHTVNCKQAENYIEVYEKNSHPFPGNKEYEENDMLNKILYDKLYRMSKGKKSKNGRNKNWR